MTVADKSVRLPGRSRDAPRLVSRGTAAGCVTTVATFAIRLVSAPLGLVRSALRGHLRDEEGRVDPSETPRWGPAVHLQLGAATRGVLP
jgi:hypothetical protein